MGGCWRKSRDEGKRVNGIQNEADERHEQKIGQRMKEEEGGDIWGCWRSRGGVSFQLTGLRNNWWEASEKAPRAQAEMLTAVPWSSSGVCEMMTQCPNTP